MKYVLLSLFILLSSQDLKPDDLIHFDSFHDEIQEDWTDSDGFLKLQPKTIDSNIDNENPVYFTAQLYYMYKMKGLITSENYHLLRVGVIQKIDSIRIIKGLYNRRPDDFSRHFSVDEQVGLLLLDYVFDFSLGYSTELYLYGEANDWRFENRTYEGREAYDDKGKKLSPLEIILESQRKPSFIGLVTTMAKGTELPWLMTSLELDLNFTSSEPKENTSRSILAYYRLELLCYKKQEFCPLRDQFHQVLKTKYQSENFLHELFKIYFKNPQHPLIKLSKI